MSLRRNRVINPAFETNVNGWTAAAPGGSADAISRATGANSPVGGQYGFTRRTGSSGRLTFATGNMAVTPGVVFSASVYIHRDGTSSLILDIDWYTSGNAFISSSSSASVSPPSATWERLAVTGTAPSTAAFGRLFVRMENTVNQFLRWDGALFETGGIGEYFDGSFVDCRWLSTAHGSASEEMSGYRRNLVANPSFEVDAAGWTTTSRSGATISSSVNRGTVAFTGKSGDTYGFVSVAGDGTNSSFDGVIFGPRFRAEPGAGYRVSAAFNNSGAGDFQHWAVVYWLNTAGSTVSTTAGPRLTLNAPPGLVRSVDLVATAPATAVQAQISLWCSAPADASSRLWRFDAVMQEVDVDGQSVDYFDGSTATANGWRGTPHNSTSYAVAVELRSGTGWAGPLGLSAGGSGAKRARGSGRARLGLRAAAAGTARRQGHGQGRIGLSGGGRGVKSTSGTGGGAPIMFGSRSTGVKRARGDGWWQGLGLGAWGSTPPPIPQFTGRPLPSTPIPMSPSRYLVANVFTGEWLHTDLPLSDDVAKVTLSGPCEITGKIRPEYADLQDSEGRPLLRSRGNIVYFEMGGQIRAGGLVTEDSFDDQTHTLVCRGVSAFPDQVSYQGRYRRYFADPLQVAREMWDYVQSFSNGRLGVEITRMGENVPVLFGSDYNAVPGQKLNGVSYGPRPESRTGANGAPVEQDQDPPIVPVVVVLTNPAVAARLVTMGYRARTHIDVTKPITDEGNRAWSPTLFVRQGDLVKAYREHFLTPSAPRTMSSPIDSTAAVTIEPFRVDWWDTKFCGEVIADAVKAVPADYVEQYGWVGSTDEVSKRILFAYPRVGRRNPGRFVVGENITAPLKLDSDPDSGVTQVVAIGAGEGSSALRVNLDTTPPGRPRKTRVYRNTRITDRTQLSMLATREFARYGQPGYSVASIVVLASHPNALYGSYAVGDDIRVEGDVPGFGWVAIWHRVMGIALHRASDLAELELKRSDTFYYGKDVPSDG